MNVAPCDCLSSSASDGGRAWNGAGLSHSSLQQKYIAQVNNDLARLAVEFVFLFFEREGLFRYQNFTPKNVTTNIWTHAWSIK